ncbi:MULTISPECIES: phosphomannomutase/phosphoglucomutase [Legionella]|uniref:phosphomannomutase n=1 Tax=Legionella septentrionalis TaxID=2498109 RepID=A0A3S0WR19_9GAMM|nr:MULTISPECIES: phosphomannomutase/phosphoglucomutase [Legionella]MCP0913665.1 phosphomannomutase/phosphoglucomutase [Legionella sp. 27cVA30]RUQ84446.1 phosphomannomutase/phosphoglucomutase [Legionella septentrionalis]RUQ94652.1 phosphomannomutase/phosphoglucomutase [Legionella septentrionalis]RUR14483.1 phosphomannomutase/phosphoglucomutase [Legionella septentrionalis]
MQIRPNYQYKAIERSVFRAYDIRGIVGTQLDENAYYSIGKAIACRLQELERGSIFLARDGRLTSPGLAAALKTGLLESGMHVIDLGAVPTPVMYYATCHYPTDCGLMVTGSHNPADYNGIKMVLAGKTLANADIDTLYALHNKGVCIAGKGRVEELDILTQYRERIISDVQLHRPFKVVVDCGNGIAGLIAPYIIEQLGCEVIPLYCEVDGRFPNHHPDPSVESNLHDLKTAVAMHRADMGLAFDGDADRLGVITDCGELIWPDRLMMLYALDVLKRSPQATIVYDVKCSSHLAEIIKQAGGSAKMCPTGHSIVKGVMKQENALLAGEMSGHIFFKDRWYGFDDAIYSACRLLEILSQSVQSVSEQFAAIPNSINTPEIKIPIAEDKKFSFMELFKQHASFPGAHVIDIDGLRVEFADGWGLIRASNTTPCLVVRFEAKDEASLSEIQRLFKASIHTIDPQLEIPF